MNGEAWMQKHIASDKHPQPTQVGSEDADRRAKEEVEMGW